MAITTLDGIIAGNLPPFPFLKVAAAFEAAAILNSLAYRPGNPPAAAVPSPGLAGAALTTYAGQIPFTNPVAGNTYLSYLEVSALLGGVLVLYDRLWHNSAIVVTTTTAQAINSVAWPARDRNGTTNGEGVQIGIEVSTATTNAAAVTDTTLDYTNSAGVAGRVGTMGSFPATAVAQTFIPFSLDTGDTGVQSIQGITLGTSYGAGAIHLVAYRIIAKVGVPQAGSQNARDPGNGVFPRLYDDSVPFLLWLSTNTTNTNPGGVIQFSQG